MGINQNRIDAIHKNALNRAWVKGFKHAHTLNANTTNNPFQSDTELSAWWLRGYENAMNLLYEPIEE